MDVKFLRSKRVKQERTERTMVTAILPCKNNRMRIPRALKLKFKGKRPMGWPRTRWFSQVLKDIKKKGESWQGKLWGGDSKLFIHQSV
jgi:hypothetical protein